MESPHSILKKVFGYDSFRPGQEEIVSRLLAGQDVLAVMPTGAGKSICYQVPALLLPGITIVVSPLVSLMKDQVGALVQAGVAAAFLNNSLTDNQKALMLRRAREGWYKIIYVAPERLEMPGFQRFAQEREISMVTVDEAHCISQWGQDFRPSYLRIKAFVDSLPKRPVVGAFTATATAHVREDIRTHLELHTPYEVTTSFDRPNLYFATRRALPSEKPKVLLDLVLRERDNAGIIYCSTTRQVDETTRLLQSRGIRATPTTPNWTRIPGGRIRTISSTTGCRSWWRPTPSAWASTSPTSDSSSIIICPRIWRAIIRRRAARAVTGSPPAAPCSIPAPMCVPSGSSSTRRWRLTTACPPMSRPKRPARQRSGSST